MKITVKINSKKYLGRYTYKCDIYIDDDYITTVNSKRKSSEIVLNLVKKFKCDYEFFQNGVRI